MKLDLNCDLGEGEPHRRTEALLRRVTSCNIACGVHAGSMQSMELCVRLAQRHGVRVGAHPGVPGAFGRGAVTWTVDEFSRQLVTQVQNLLRAAELGGARLHHVKLHGALYHRSEQDPEYTRVLLRIMADVFPGVTLYAAAGGRVAAGAIAKGVPVWEEGFLDRGYRPDGTLIPRGSEGAILTGSKALTCRLEALRLDGRIPLPGGRALRVRTLCLHGDHADSLRTATLAAKALQSVLDSPNENAGAAGGIGL